MEHINPIQMGKRVLIALFCLAILSKTAAQTHITGTVTDAATSEALIGVSVSVKNANTGTVTDLDGKYQLDLPKANATLVFSYTGFAPQEIPLGGRTTVDVRMGETSQMVNEVVVVAYGTQRKSDLTGAVSSVKASELKNIASPDISTALQGKVAGLEAIGNGRPGQVAQLTVRGTGTFSSRGIAENKTLTDQQRSKLQGGNPIFVVDGVILDDPANISANEVESVEVLKDASAVSLYGARGANGVILITTKKGATGATRFSLNTYYGVQQVTKKLDLANAKQYATLANEAAKNTGSGAIFTDAQVANFGAGTDWQDVIFQNAPMNSIQLSARGGTDKTLFYISGEALHQDGIVRSGVFDRYTFRINNSYKLADFLKIGHNLSANFSENNGEPGGIIFNAYAADPTIPVRDSAGHFGSTSLRSNVGNPAAMLEYQAYNRWKEFRTVGNVWGEVYFLKNFTFRSSLGFDVLNAKGKNYQPAFFVDTKQQNEHSVLTVSWGNTRDWQNENLLFFNKNWAEHRLELMAGMTAQDHFEEYLYGTKRDIAGADEDFFYLDAAATDEQYGNGVPQWYRYLSYLGRANYTFKDRYLLTVNFRRDGSSKFGANNRWGNFPSVALGWRVYEEPFFPKTKWLTNLKLRGSYGITGNDKIDYDRAFATITNRLFAVFGAGSNEALAFGAIQTSLSNPSLQWEENRHTNVGAEIGLFGGRLTAELDWFKKEGVNVITDPIIPSYIGSKDNPLVNIANVQNTGFEWNVRWNDQFGEKGWFRYHVGFTGNTLRNEVTKLSLGKTEILGGWTGTALSTRTVVGGPIGGFYGYKVAGVYQDSADVAAYPNRNNVVPGDLRFVDVDGNDTINTKDRTYLGSPIPDLMLGIHVGIEFAGVDFSVDLYGVSGNKILNAKRMNRFFGVPNFETSFLDRWTGTGTSNSEPRVTNGAEPNYLVSERFLEDGSYFRIRNIVLGYSLPKRVLGRLGLESLRGYVSATNPVTWAKYSGYSPEVGGGPLDRGLDRDVYPVARVFSFGVNAGF